MSLTTYDEVPENEDWLRRVAATGAPPPFVSVPSRAGRYEVRERLGRGGLGLVHVGWDPRLQRDVAIKFVRPDRSGGETGLQLERRLRKEAEILARLDHPNVVDVYDVGEVDGRVFLAMQRLEGQSLRSWLRAEQRSTRAIVRAFLEAGNGLVAAHEAGLVHRDFKLDNVVIDERGRVYLIDFGIASAPQPRTLSGVHSDENRSTATATTGVVGTRGYIAPEVLAGSPATEASDQYSFCVALCEALTGMPADACARNPALATASLPRRLGTAIARGLRAIPQERHTSMRALLAELVPRRRTTTKWVAGVVCVGLVFGLAWWGHTGTPPPCGAQGAAPCEVAVDGVAAPPLEVQGEVAEVRRRLELARTFRERNDAVNSTAEADAALQHAEALGYAPLLAEALFARGMAHWGDGSRDDIRAFLEPAHHQATAAKHDSVAFEAALYLVDLARQEGQFDVAHDWLERARASAARLDAPDADARLLQLDGKLAFAAGAYEEALEKQSAAAKLLEANGGDPGDLSIALRDAAAAAAFLDRFDEARAYYRRALASHENERDGGGPSLGETLRDFAQIESWQGRLDEALPLIDRAMEIHEQVYGADSTSLAADRKVRAEILTKLERNDEALKELELSSQYYQQFEPDSSDWGLTLASLARLYERTEALPEAIEAYSRALVILQATAGPNASITAQTLLFLALARMQAGELDRALDHAREAEAANVQLEGADGPSVGYAVRVQAQIHLEAGELDEALALAKRAEAILENRPVTRALAWTWFVLGRIHWERGDDRELALRYVRRATEYYAQGEGSESGALASIEAWRDEHVGSRREPHAR